MKTKSRFWVGLSCYCLVLVVVVIAALCVLKRFLVAYEDSRPEHTVTYYVENLTPQDVIGGCGKLLDSLDPALQTREDAEKILMDAMSEPFRAVKEPSSQGELCYSVRSGKRKVGGFHLVSRSTGSFGFPIWEVEGESFDLSWLAGPETSLTVPDSARITFQGKELPRDYVTRSEIPFDLFREFPQEGLPQCSTYVVKGYLGEADWQVFTQDGEEVTGQDYQAVFAGTDCTDVQKEALEARVMKFLDQYIAYCGSNKNTSRGNLYSLRKSLVPNGQLFQRLTSALDGLNFGQSLGDKRGQTEIHTMLQVDEELFFVDVTYLVDTTGKKGVVSTTNNLKLLLVPSKDTFLVSDMCSY